VRADRRLLRLAAPVATLLGVGAAFGYVAVVDPGEPGHYPVCPLLRYTGLYCPGCGGLRAAHAVAHGDLVAALGANALAVVFFAVFACGWTVWLIAAVRGRPPRLPMPAGSRPWWLLGAVLAAFTVVRNLPFGAVLAP
jgi:hypothetical protein